MSEKCEECGAPLHDGGVCRDYFHTLLAREWHAPGSEGPLTHFLLVSSYLLQHPRSMGCNENALDGLARGIADALNGKASIEMLRHRAARAEGAIRRRPGDPVPELLTQTWSVTAADVCAAPDESFQSAVRDWARSVCDVIFEPD